MNDTAMTDEDLDAAIIDILIEDGRASGSEIARQVPVPSWRTRARLAYLLAQDSMRVTAFVDPVLVGRPIVVMLDISAADSESLPDRLVDLDSVAWVARCESGHVYAQVSVASTRELATLLNTNVRTLAGVNRVATNLLLRGVSRSLRRTSDIGPLRPFTFLGGAERTVDEVDMTIIATLQRDGRTPFTALSSLTGLSIPAARQRYQRLVSSGTLSVAARPWPSLLGRDVTAHIKARVSGSTTPLVTAISDIPDVTFIAECTGDADLLIELSCTDRGLLEKRLSLIREIEAITTMVVDVHIDARAVSPNF